MLVQRTIIASVVVVAVSCTIFGFDEFPGKSTFVSRLKNSENLTQLLAAAADYQPDNELVEGVTEILIDEQTTEEVQDAAAAIMSCWLNEKGVLPSKQLVEALLSDRKSMRELASAMLANSKFGIDSLDVVAKAARSTHPRAYLAVSHLFVDLQRLEKLSQNSDTNIRRLATERLWESTRRPDLLLRSLFTFDSRIPSHLLEARESLEKKIAENRRLYESAESQAVRDQLCDELYEIERSPALLQISRMNFATLHFLGTCKSIVACNADPFFEFVVESLHAPELEFRKRFAQVLPLIVNSDSFTRKADALSMLSRLESQECELEIKTTLQQCVLAIQDTPRPLLAPSADYLYVCPSDDVEGSRLSLHNIASDGLPPVHIVRPGICTNTTTDAQNSVETKPQLDAPPAR